MDTINFTFNLLFYFIIIVSLDYTICKDDVLVKSCPEDKASWDTAARRKECKPDGSKNYVYHCLKNERQELVETCLVAQWIEIGVCPVLFNGGNFGFENCTLIMLRTGGACPKTAYRSNELYRFPICFEILPKTTMTQLNTTTEITTVSGTPDTPGDSNSSRNATNGNKNEKPDSKTIGVIVIVVLLVIIIGIVVGLFILERRRGALPYGIVLCNDVEQGQERTEKTTPQSAKRIVQLDAYEKGLCNLKEHGILIITGQIGRGKTTAMENIIQLLKEEEKDWKVKDISSFPKVHSYVDKIVIKWDDCFGKFVINPVKKVNTLERLKKIFKWVKEGNGNRKLILTMRDSEFEKSNVEDLFEIKENAASNEAHLLQTEEKASYCKMCLDNMEEEKNLLIDGIFKDACERNECSGNHLEEIKKELMAETESETFSLLGWPLICRLAIVPDIAADIKSFKKDPVRCVMSLFDTLKSRNQQLYCAMIYVLFKGGNISKIDTAFLKKVSEKLAPAQDGKKLISSGKSESTDNPMKFSRNELNNIFHTHPHYFVQKGKQCFEFHHEVFVLWLLCHFYHSFPETTIEHFDVNILIELLRPNNYIVERNENDIEMLCRFGGNVPEEKHDNPGIEGDGDKKLVQCKEDIKTGIQTTSSDTLKQTEEGKSENQSWKFILEEKMFSFFIKRVVKEKEEVKKILVEKEQKYGMLEGHPLLEDLTFLRIYSPEKALTSVQD